MLLGAAHRAPAGRHPTVRPRHVGFPPGSRFVLLPVAPRRAATSALALWEAVERRQTFALRAGSVLTRLGLHRLLPRTVRPEVDMVWWWRWVREVAEEHVGRVSHLAFRIPGNPRVSALLLDRRGRPLGFAKLVAEDGTGVAEEAGRLLGEDPSGTFHVPHTLGAGTFEDVAYRLLEPLPEGPHHPPPLEPERLWSVVDVMQERLSSLAGPPDSARQHVICHADLTPRNLRVASDGTWWLFDWDLVRLGPPLADELRYWTAWHVYRRPESTARSARRVLDLLQRRGTTEEIREAIEWPGRVQQTYREREHDVHNALAAMVRA